MMCEAAPPVRSPFSDISNKENHVTSANGGKNVQPNAVPSSVEQVSSG